MVELRGLFAGDSSDQHDQRSVDYTPPSTPQPAHFTWWIPRSALFMTSGKVLLPLRWGMNDQNEANWHEVQLKPQHWASIPQSAGLWHEDQPDDAAESRLLLAEEMTLILHTVLLTALTPRQRQVIELYFLENHTQVEIANALGISQAAVCQHLSGKRRGLAHVGGAFRKIRKAIHKLAARRKQTDTRYAQIIHTMDQLLDHSLTHRRARMLLDSLAHRENREK